MIVFVLCESTSFTQVETGNSTLGQGEVHAGNNIIFLILLFFQVLTRSEGDETGWKWAYYGDIPENAVPCADSLMDEGKNKLIKGLIILTLPRIGSIDKTVIC